MRAATIYVRQSQDKARERAAVSRQLSACRALCAEKGWPVAEVYTDNDVSATTGRVRPGFEALLASAPDRIVVWHVDRLVRLSKDLERVIELGVNVYAVKSGHVDLSHPAGRAVAKTITAWAQYEGEQKATRQVAANRQRAQRGEVLWSRRPFGFDRDGAQVRIVKAEAAEIRKAAKKVLKGATLASVAADWDARGVTTTTGRPWSVTSVRRVLLNPRTAGRVVSQGEDYGSNGLAILDADTADRLAALLHDPGRKCAPSTQVKYLMSGLARCGRDGCDGRVMFATVNPHGATIYRCTNCYGARRADRVDEVAIAAVITRLSRPDAARLFDPDIDLDDLRERITDLRSRRDGLASLLAEGLLTADVVRTQAQRLTSTIDDLGQQIQAATGTGPLSRVVDSVDIAAAVGRLSLLDLRSVIRELVTVWILPAGKGVPFDLDQVRIEWRAGS